MVTLKKGAGEADFLKREYCYAYNENMLKLVLKLVKLHSFLCSGVLLSFSMNIHYFIMKIKINVVFLQR